MNLAWHRFTVLQNRMNDKKNVYNIFFLYALFRVDHTSLEFYWENINMWSGTFIDTNLL